MATTVYEREIGIGAHKGTNRRDLLQWATSPGAPLVGIGLNHIALK